MDQPASLDSIRLESRTLFLTKWKFTDTDKLFADVVQEQKEHLIAGNSLQAKFVNDVAICMFTYTLRLNDQFVTEIIKPEDIRRVAIFYMIEQIYILFDINLQHAHAWLGINHVDLLSCSLANVCNYNSDFYRQGMDNITKPVGSIQLPASRDSDNSSIHSVSSLKPVLTEKSKGRLGSLLGRKKPPIGNINY